LTARAARQGQARPALLRERTPIKHRTGENQAEGRYFRAWPFAHPSAHLLIDRPVGPSVKYWIAGYAPSDPATMTLQRPMSQELSYVAGLCRHFVAHRSCQCTTVNDEHASVIVAQGNRISVQKAYKHASCFRDLSLYIGRLGTTELNG